MDGFSEEAGGAGDSLQNLAQAVAAAGILDKLDDIYDSFMECSAAAAEYETSLKKVETIADTSSISMGDISSSIMKLSSETGIAAKDLSEAAYQAISASVGTADAVGFVGTANKLAAGGFTDASSAVDVLTTTINAYGLEAGEASKISDYLITTQNKGKTTVGELASSVGKIIPVAAAYNVQMDNLSAALAVMTANGIQTAEAATYIKSMLNELSDTGSEVAKELVAQTGKSFSELSSIGYSLGDVMQVLGDSVNGSATALSNLWGSSEAGTASLSLYNSGAQKYNEVLGEMRNSAGATEAAYQTMTQTVEFSQQRMSVASENLQVAIGETLNPAIQNVYDLAADILAGTQEFVEKNPDTVAAVTSVATAIGVATASITALTVATKAYTIAKTALSAVPGIGWIAAGVGIVGAVAGMVQYASMTSDAADETEKFTFETREMQNGLKRLNRQYDEVCKRYGKNSDEANKLALQVETLRQEYSRSKQTIGEFTEEIDNLSKSVSDTYKSYKKEKNNITGLVDSSSFLVSGLAALEGQAGLTEAQMQTLAGIADKLNNSYNGLGLTIDETTGKLNYSADELFEYITKAAEKKKQEAAKESLIAALQDFSGLKEKSEKAANEVSAAWAVYQDARASWMEANPAQAFYAGDEYEDTYYFPAALVESRDEWKAQKDAQEDVASSYGDCLKNIKEYAIQIGYTDKEARKFINSLEKSSKAAEKNSRKLNNAGKINEKYAEGMEKVKSAAGNISGELSEMAEAYDKTFKAVYENIDGQIGLFDKYETKSKMTTDKMAAAWKSQEKYLKKYSKNIKEASKAGLDEDVIQKLSDGSQEAAGQLDVIVKKYKEIENSNGSEAAKKWVKQFNRQFKAVEKSKETFSSTVTKMEQDFGKHMKSIVSQLKKSVKDMDMSGTAGKAAEATMDAYIAAIKSKTAEAANEAYSMKNAVADAMELGNKTSTRKGKKYTKNHNSGKGYVPVPEAEGDILTKPTLAWIAEAGYDEAVIPVNGSARSRALWEETGERLGMFNKDGSRKSATSVLERFDAGKNTGINSGSTDGSLNTKNNTEFINNTESTQDIMVEVPFSPVINIYGSAGRKEIKEAGKEIKMSYNDFKKHMERCIGEYLRRTTGQGVHYGKLYNSVR